MDDWSSRYREYENQCVEASKLTEGTEKEAAYRSAEELREELLRDPDAPQNKVCTEREKLLTRIVAYWLIHGNELSEYQRNAWSRWIDNPTDKTPLAKHPKFLELAEEWQDCVQSESPSRAQNLSRFSSTENQALELAELLGSLRGQLHVTVPGGELQAVAVDAGKQGVTPSKQLIDETVVQAALRWSQLRKFEDGPTEDQQAFVVALVEKGGSSLPVDIGCRMGKDWKDPKRSCALLIKAINKKLVAKGEVWQIVPEDRGEVVLAQVSPQAP